MTTVIIVTENITYIFHLSVFCFVKKKKKKKIRAQKQMYIIKICTYGDCGLLAFDGEKIWSLWCHHFFFLCLFFILLGVALEMIHIWMALRRINFGGNVLALHSLVCWGFSQHDTRTDDVLFLLGFGFRWVNWS